MAFDPEFYKAGDFSFNFRLYYEQDVEFGVVRLWDYYGFFLPIPIAMWNRVVNETLMPQIAKDNPTMHLEDVFEEAVKKFARMNDTLYICSN